MKISRGSIFSLLSSQLDLIEGLPYQIFVKVIFLTVPQGCSPPPLPQCLSGQVGPHTEGFVPYIFQNTYQYSDKKSNLGIREAMSVSLPFGIRQL